MSTEPTPKIQDYLSYYGAKPFIFLVRLMPHKLALRLARALGWLAFYVLPFRKRVVMENLRVAFGREKSETEILLIARKCYQNFAMMFTEFIRLPILPAKYIASLVKEIEGEEYYQKLGGKNGGYLSISGHLGSWELVVQYFTFNGVPVSVIVRPMHNRLFDAEINQTRAEKGMKVILTQNPLKDLIADIRSRRVVVFLVDQDARKAGIFVDFFGKPASTFTGAAVLAQRFGLPILPVFTVRTGLDTHKIIFKPPLLPQKYRDRGLSTEAVIQQLVQEYTQAVESVVRNYPEQYFWFHRRWKTKTDR